MNLSPLNREELLNLIRSTAEKSTRSILTYQEFKSITGTPIHRVLQHFDSWTEACIQAGVRPGQASPSNLTPRYSRGKEHALSEVKRVANILGVSTLSRAQFNSQSTQVKASTVATLWGSWGKALEAAGLKRHPLYYDEIPLAKLAEDFLNTVKELKKIPTIRQLSRRSVHGINSFSRKFGSYTKFKASVIKYLLSGEKLADELHLLLASHLGAIERENAGQLDSLPPPHAKGRHLGFRAFAFVPTYETEVVSLFSAVADELGFEIIAQRPAFPDCEARRMIDTRRKRYSKCLIEFEFRSSDYRTHDHPIKGCDLIVCWEHNWSDCPLEVLELSSKIRYLPGWR